MWIVTIGTPPALVGIRQRVVRQKGSPLPTTTNTGGNKDETRKISQTLRSVRQYAGQLEPWPVSRPLPLVRDAGVGYCVYGHLHGEDARHAFEGEHEGVGYRCVSADLLGFSPALILEL